MENIISSEIMAKMKENFNRNRINIVFKEKIDDVIEFLLYNISSSETVGIGNSQTLKTMNIRDILNKRGNIVYDKTLYKNKEDIRKINRLALLSDCYISSANAISIDGSIVNIDHSGNRVAAITYGPDIVFIIVGKNKIVDTKKEAIERAKNMASPLNAKRAGYNPHCVELNYCIDCKSKERVCNYLSITTGQSVENRLTLIVVNSEFGF